jgi:hypothetical protein
VINKYIQILADSEIESDEINEDFGKGPFKYTRGDIIAQDEPEAFYFGHEFFTPLTSVFTMVQNGSLSYGEWKLDADSDQVGIEVNPKMKDKFDRARATGSNRQILLNLGRWY